MNRGQPTSRRSTDSLRPPVWKRWLSYLIEQHLESASSEHNPHLYVSLSRGRYQLCTANAIYSFEDRYDNYRRAFARIDLSELPGPNVLVLGFGLGSIPILLEHTFQHRFNFTGVEIDEAVIDLASRYALPQLDSPVQLVCADAMAYAQQAETVFDLVCMDVFLDDTIPAGFEQPEFLKDLRRLIHPEGLLLYNRLADNRDDQHKSKQFYEDVFLSIFPKGAYLDVGGNWMLVNEAQWLA